MERLSRTAFQYGSCRLFVWRRCSPVQQMSAHRSVLQAALLRQSLIARFGACIEGFAHLDSTQTRMAHSSVCCSSSASSLRSYDPPNPSVERSFSKSRSARSLQALCPNTPRPPGQDAVGVINPLRLRLQRLSQCIGHLVQRLPVLLLLATVALQFPVAEAIVSNSDLAHCGLSSSSKVISFGCGTGSCTITPSFSGKCRPQTTHQ